MHNHSRFQRDINDVTGVSLSLPLTKVTDAQYRKRFRASYNMWYPIDGPSPKAVDGPIGPWTAMDNHTAERGSSFDSL